MNPLMRLFAAPLLCCLLMLAGCGPTGGGTGTGEVTIGPADFGARPDSVCAASIAGQLSCQPTVTLPGEVPQAQGTAKVVFAGEAASGPYTLTWEGNALDLQSRCGPTHFGGEWGVLASGEGRAFGRFTGPDRGVQRAQLAVQALPAGGGTADGLQVLVLDADGRSLFGPLQLRRLPVAPTDAPACP